MGSSNLGLLFANIKWYRVDEGFRIFNVVVYSSFVPNLFNGLVVDISKWRFGNNIRIQFGSVVGVFEQIGMVTKPHQSRSSSNESQLDAKFLVNLVSVFSTTPRT